MLSHHSTMRHAILLVLMLIVSGCATVTSNVYHSSSGKTPPLSSKVLVLPPDATVYLKNAGGNNEARADWSDQVRNSLAESVMEFMFERGIQAILYGSDRISDEHIDILRQATVMMDAVQLMQSGGGLGSERLYALSSDNTEQLKPFGADYLLITQLSAERASGGRQAVAVLGALAGATVSTSSASFRAAIFDLRDGQLTWANVDRQALTDIGDVLKASDEKWIKATEHILSEFPL